jgi:prepilin-type N-terminal cleavage/methylation domain-containing protein
MAKFKNDKGLTLIELLITIAVLAIVSAIALPVINNVVASSNSNALQQTIKDAQSFINKYSKSGVVAYDSLTKTFRGYIDTDGDNQIDANELIDTLVLDEDKYTAVLNGTSPALGGSYSNGGVTGATIIATTGGSTAPVAAGATTTFGTSAWSGGPNAFFNNGWVVFTAATASDGSGVEYAIEISTDGGNTWIQKGKKSSPYLDHNGGMYLGGWFTHADAMGRSLYVNDQPYGFSNYDGPQYAVIGIPNLYTGNPGTQIRILSRSVINPSANPDMVYAGGSVPPSTAIITVGPSITTEW